MQKVHDLLIHDLDNLYSTILRANARQGIIINRRQICEQISRLPAPRLYITPEYAMRVISRYPKRKARKYTTVGMHEELFERYQELPPDQRTIIGISRLILQPAKSFYLSPRTISDLLYKIYDRKDNTNNREYKTSRHN